MLKQPNILFPNPDNKKVVKLLAELKTRGYMAYVYILHHLYSNGNAVEANYKSLGYQLHYPANLVQSVIEDFDLFVVEGGMISSLDIKEREQELLNFFYALEEEKRQNEISRKRAEAGRKGMATRWKDNKTDFVNNKPITKDDLLITNNNKTDFVMPNSSNSADYNLEQNVDVSDLTEKEKEEKEISPPLNPSLKEKELKEKEEELNDANASLSSNEDASSTSREEQIDFAALVRYWNNTTNGVFGKILSIENQRRKMVTARIKQWGKHNFIEAIKMAMESDFLKGQKGFLMTFDWFIRPNNFQKVLEHNYDNRTIPTNNGAGGNARNGNRATDDARAVYRNLDELTAKVVLSPSDVQGLL